MSTTSVSPSVTSATGHAGTATGSAPVSALRMKYEDEGFLLVPQIGLPAELVSRAARGLENVRDGIYDSGLTPEGSQWQPGGRPDVLVKIEQPQLGNLALRELISHEAIGKLALELTGAEWVQVWWVQGLIKPSTPAGGKLISNVGWHQDKQYWSQWSPDSELFTCWVALSDVPANSGPMCFARGSNHWGLLNQGDFWAQDETTLMAKIKVPEGRKWEEVQGILPAGGVSFHHQYTFHGSGQNTAGFPRMSLALHMRTSKSNINPGEKDVWVDKWTKFRPGTPIWRAK